jgi:hypothetical protein
MEILKKYDLLDKVSALSADNTNTNFGGAKRKGRNNVFFFCKLGQNIDKQLIGIGCGTHVLHNSIQTAADSLPVDSEATVYKIFHYFNIFTITIVTERILFICGSGI